MRALRFLLAMTVAADAAAWAWAILCPVDEDARAHLALIAIHSVCLCVFALVIGARRQASAPERVVSPTLPTPSVATEATEAAPVTAQVAAPVTTAEERPRSLAARHPELGKLRGDVQAAMGWSDEYIRDPANVLEIARGARALARANRIVRARVLVSAVVPPSDPDLLADVEKELAVATLHIAQYTGVQAFAAEMRRLVTSRRPVLEAVLAEPPTPVTPRSLVWAIRLALDAHTLPAATSDPGTPDLKA